MTAFCVYLPPNGQAAETGEGYQLISDAKAPWALIAPPVWLAVHRLWFALLIYLLAIGCIIMIAYFQPGTAVMYLSALPGLFLLLEGRQLIRSKLERSGWQYAGTFHGDDEEEAEIRYLETTSLDEKPGDVDHSKSKPFSILQPSIAKRSVHSTTNGLFPE